MLYCSCVLVPCLTGGLMATTLYIFRHGETHAKHSKPELVSGARYNTALTDEGKAFIARFVGGFFADKEVHVVFTSPSDRSIESAKAAFEKSKKQPYMKSSENFREIDYGVFEGKPVEEYQQAKKRYVDDGGELTLATSIGGAESYVHASDRFYRTLVDVGEIFAGQIVAISSHSGIMRSLVLCEKINAADVPEEDLNMVKKDIPYGTIFHIVYENGVLHLKSVYSFKEDLMWF